MRFHAIIAATVLASSLQAATFPIYDNQRLERPAGLRQFNADEFKIDLRRVEARSGGHLYGSKENLLKLGRFFLSDPNGKEQWLKLADSAAATLNRWDFNRRGFAANRYVYGVSALNTLALVHMYTGHQELGRFIRGHLLQIAALPFEFWLHAELRGYNPKRPLGMLETASLCTTCAVTLSFSADLFTPAEKQQLDTALRTKGLQPCLNWLSKPAKNNFTAVISSGAYVAARYFNDRPAMDKAVKAMTGYLNHSIEADGSYGEGSGYFGYPISSLLPAVLCMTPEERRRIFAASGLRHSARWEVYPYLYERGPDGKMLPTMVHFGDNSFFSWPSPSVNLIIASIGNDGVATWLLRKFDRELRWSDHLLAYSIPGGLPAPQSPQQAGLPLLKTFDSGDCYLRSNWDDNGIVLALRSGNGSRISFSHQRAELNSIGLGAYGEYLVVSPGSASYRSPLHYTWDWTTRAANTVTIDDRNQLFPGSGRSSWFKGDNAAFWQSGRPEAKVVVCRAGKFADLLVNEAARAYHIPMLHARRAVLFVRDPGYFVIVDHLEAKTGDHKYTWRLHFNNRDGKAELKTGGDGNWNLSRPRASLRLRVAASAPLDTATAPGYMHGTGRDYSPGGEHEGKPGSSIEFSAWNVKPARTVTFTAILFPVAKGQAEPSVTTNGNQVTVGQDVLSLKDGELILSHGEKVEKFRLW